MKIILKPAGWISLLGVIGVLTTIILALRQQTALQSLPETPPIPQFQTAPRAAGDPVFDDAAKMQPVDLTEVGAKDWAHFGLGGNDMVVRKAGTRHLIGKVDLIGKDTKILPKGKQGPSRGVTWSDGDSVKKTNVTYDGIHVGIGNGFRLEVRTSTEEQTFYLLVGGYKAEGLLNAFMSDGSATTINHTEVALGSGYYSRLYKIQFHATLPGQTLKVTWRADNGTGNISLQAAAIK